ncbi:MAG: zinc ribbon domain-containing protein, partial [Bacteroidia bacterium]|nr:zinc ribbon domain-containing protein [Bacteroidia bacterium]
MKVCNYCGVELDADMNFCPLCGHKSNSPVVKSRKEIIHKDPKDAGKAAYNFEDLTHRQQRKVVWELAAFVLISISVITLIIDLLITRQITWSKYTLTVGLVLLIDITLIIFLQKQLFLLFSGCFISTSLLLFMLDLYIQNSYCGLKLGIPIIFFTCLIIFLLAILIRKSKQKGINIIAYSLLAAGIVCMCVEGIIALHTQNQLRLQWSLVVLVSVLPVSAILLYIHYRLKRVTNLRKAFHI